VEKYIIICYILDSKIPFIPSIKNNNTVSDDIAENPNCLIIIFHHNLK